MSRADHQIRHIDKWLGDAWLCPDCGRVLRKPNLIMDRDRLHSMHCPTAMVRVVIDWHPSEVSF